METPEHTEPAARRATGQDEVSQSGADSVLRWGFVVALALLTFLAGAVVVASKTFPGPQLADAYEGGHALYSKLTGYSDPFTSDLWKPERTPRKGVTIYDPLRAENGETLYAGGQEAAAYLIDMRGNVLHEWRRPYSTVWNKTASVKKPQPDEFVYFRKVRMVGDGDLLAIYEGVGDTPYGYGMVKLDRNSNVIWSYLGYTHHDFDVGPDGRIYVLTHEITTEPMPEFGNLVNPRIDDFLVVLSPEGKELAKIRLILSVAGSPYKHLLHTVSSYSVGDPLHTNDVDYITAETARNFPMGKPGQLLLSFRELGAIGVLDVQRRKMVWMTRGPWIGQHDPDILANGDILLFDNYGNYEGPAGISRVLEFDPRNMQIVWQYAGNANRPFDSFLRSEQERLANGNTLIVESNGGRIFEVTRAGDIVWEFINPARSATKDRKTAVVSSAERIATDRVALAP
jgi:Arylsulfotransferase (ASST)